ncbi:hypothetical protein AGDE_16196 [Angomonas deanei]|nr:hypothetical protein AGDE_16196 [Angomonas deanei]|eukprot:EPY17565.1 hypothetical protein AGDE_16196 [Angomonas deanei]
MAAERRKEVAQTYRTAAADPPSDARPEKMPVNTLRQVSRQNAEKALRQFERVFVEGPPVLVPYGAGEEPLVSSLRELLRPVDVSALLPSPDNELDAYTGILMARQFTVKPVEIQNEVEEEPAAEEAPVSPEVTEIEVSMVADAPAEPPVVHNSELKEEEPREDNNVPEETPMKAAADVPPNDAADAGPSEDARVGVVGEEDTHTGSNETSSVSFSSTDTEEELTVSDLASALDTTTASSGSSHPTMTAEQLRVALLRLRNRMRNNY